MLTNLYVRIFFVYVVNLLRLVNGVVKRMSFERYFWSGSAFEFSDGVS